MAATFNWNQRTQSGPSTGYDLGVSGNLFNFKSQDSNTPSNYTSYPVTAGNRSFEVWLRGHFTGTFNKIQNCQFWKSSGSYGTGESMDWGTTSTWTNPVSTDGAKTTGSVPTADPGTQNVYFSGGSTSTNAVGFSNYIVLQLATTSAAEAGDTETFTFTLQYDEN